MKKTEIIKYNKGLQDPRQTNYYAPSNSNKITTIKGWNNGVEYEKLALESAGYSIILNKTNYIIIDIDADKEKQHDEMIKEAEQTLILLCDSLDEYGYIYRVDRTASGKFHIWLKWSNELINNKQFYVAENKTAKDYFSKRFYKQTTTLNNPNYLSGFIEVFTKHDTHLMTLAGSVNCENEKYLYLLEPDAIKKLKTLNNDNINKHFRNITDDFSELSEASAILDIIDSVLFKLSYYQNYNIFASNDTKTGTKSFIVKNTDYSISCRKYKGNYNFSLWIKDKTKAIIKENDFIKIQDLEYYDGTLKNYEKNIINKLNDNAQYNEIINDNSIVNNAIIKTLVSIILYIQQTTNKKEKYTDVLNAGNTNAALEQLIELIANQSQSVDLTGKRNEFFMALGNYTTKYFNNETDATEFYNTLTDAMQLTVDKKTEHKGAFLNAIKNKENLKDRHLKGLKTVLNILELDYKDINFVNDIEKGTKELLERLHPEPSKHEEGYNDFLLFYNANKEGKFKSIGMKPCDNILDFLVEIVSLNVYNEKSAIAVTLLAMISAIAGYDSLFLSATGGSGTGKSTIINSCLDIMPDANVIKSGSLSRQYIYYITQDMGERYFDHCIVDLGDKGDELSRAKVKELFGMLQGLITEKETKHGAAHTEENKKTGKRGTVNLTLTADSIAVVVTSIFKIDAANSQIESRTQHIETNPSTDPEEIKLFNTDKKHNAEANSFYKLIKPFIKDFLSYQIATIDAKSVMSNIWNYSTLKWSNILKTKDREKGRLDGYLATYSWLNYNDLHAIKGIHDKTYYIPDASIINSFKRIISKSIGVLGSREKEFYNWLVNDSGFSKLTEEDVEVNKGNLRTQLVDEQLLKDNNFFTKRIIRNKLDKNKARWTKEIDVFSTVDILYNLNILTRLDDRDKNNNNIYYINALNDVKTEIELDFNSTDIQDAKKTMKEKRLEGIEEYGAKNYRDIALTGDLKGPLIFNLDNYDFIDGSGDIDIRESKDDNIIETNNINPLSDTTEKRVNKDNNINSLFSDRTNNFVNLHVHSCESIGDGACTINQLVDAAKENNQRALALTNHGTLNGLNYFNKQCKEKGIKAILGVEAYVTEERNHLVLLAENKQGYYDLLNLHNNAVRHIEETKKKTERYNGRYVNGGVYLNEFKLSDKYNNLTALSGCVAGIIPRLLIAGKYEEAKQKAIDYNTIFNHFYLEIQEHAFKNQEIVNDGLYRISNETGIKLIITGDVHYIDNIQNWEIVQNKKFNHANTDNSFKIDAPSDLAKNTIEVAKYIEEYDLDNKIQLPDGRGVDWLKDYCYNKLTELKINDQRHFERLNEELRVITKNKLTTYHTVLYDIVKLLKNHNISIGGRGSAVGSLVCYLLGFHNIDPLKYNLLFERYLNDSRIEAGTLPDVDLNIESDKRDYALELIRNKYKNVAQIAAFAEFSNDSKELFNRLEKFSGADIMQLNGVKYQLTKHAGGIIISENSFNDFMPLTFSKDGDIITDCDKYEVEALGGVKYDLLGDKQQIINKGVKLTEDDLKNKELAKFIKEYPLGIFQFGNYSGIEWLKNNNPESFNDYVKGTAEIRPSGTKNNNKWIMQEEMMLEATKHGLTLAEADYLRKPKGKTETDKINFTTTIVEKMQDITEAEKQDFKEYFKSYSFNKSHAVVYTFETFKNAKLKYSNPSEFYARVINNNVGDDLLVTKLLIEAMQLNVEILTPCRRYIEKECKALDNNKLQLGTLLIKGISNKTNLKLKNGGYCKALKEYLKLNKDKQRIALGIPSNVKSNKTICLNKEKGKGKLKYKLFVQQGNIIATLLIWDEDSKIKKIERGSAITDDIIVNNQLVEYTVL